MQYVPIQSSQWGSICDRGERDSPSPLQNIGKTQREIMSMPKRNKASRYTHKPISPYWWFLYLFFGTESKIYNCSFSTQTHRHTDTHTLSLFLTILCSSPPLFYSVNLNTNEMNVAKNKNKQIMLGPNLSPY